MDQDHRRGRQGLSRHDRPNKSGPLLSARQRVLAALAHRQPDRTPFHLTFTAPARETMRKWYGDPDFEASLGNCLTVLRTRLPERELDGQPGIWEDEFGVQWDRRVDPDIGTVCNRRVTAQTLKGCRFPDPRAPARFARFPSALREKGDRFALATLAFTLFERAWTLAGMEELLAAMLIDKSFAHALFDRILEYDLEVVRQALEYEVDGVRFGDDWGGQRGLLMGPALWREFIKPRMAALYGLVKAAGKRVFIHCCGKVDELFPELIQIGVDVFNPFQPEVMDVQEMKRRYGSSLTFFGGISTQRTLPYGTVAEVKAEVRRLLERVGRGGGYIAAPAHDVPRDARPENVAAMIEVLRAQ